VIGVLAAVGISIFAARAVAAQPSLALAAGGLVIVLGLIAVATRRPRPLAYVAVISLVIYPFVASRKQHFVTLDPGLLLLWVLALALTAAAIAEGRRRALTLIDIAVIIFALAMVASAVAGHNGFTTMEGELFLWIGPYIAGRTLRIRAGATAIPTALIAGAAVLAPFLVYEFATGTNLFTTYIPGAVDATNQLGTAAVRGGATRIQGSFGQPIPLAIFLTTAAICAVGLVDVRKTRTTRVFLWGVALALVVLSGLTLSRLNWVLLGVALIWILANHPRFLVRPARLGLVAVSLTALLAVGAFTPAEQTLFNPDQGAAQSSSYRAGLLRFALQPGVIQPFGSRQRFLGPGGATSIDDEYVLIATQWGLVAFIALALVASSVVITGIRTRGSRVDVMVTAATAGNLVVLYGVALLTQAQIVVWLLVGACSGAEVHRRVARESQRN
jgi:hypothetical protein